MDTYDAVSKSRKAKLKEQKLKNFVDHFQKTQNTARDRRLGTQNLSIGMIYLD